MKKTLYYVIFRFEESYGISNLMFKEVKDKFVKELKDSDLDFCVCMVDDDMFDKFYGDIEEIQIDQFTYQEV